MVYRIIQCCSQFKKYEKIYINYHTFNLKYTYRHYILLNNCIISVSYCLPQVHPKKYAYTHVYIITYHVHVVKKTLTICVPICPITYSSPTFLQRTDSFIPLPACINCLTFQIVTSRESVITIIIIIINYLYLYKVRHLR